MAATYQSAEALGIAALDELANIPGSGLTPVSVRLAGVGTITQAQYDAVVAARDAAIAERDARQAAITAMKAAAQAEKDADAANVAGQGVLTAAGTF